MPIVLILASGMALTAATSAYADPSPSPSSTSSPAGPTIAIVESTIADLQSKQDGIVEKYNQAILAQKAARARADKAKQRVEEAKDLVTQANARAVSMAVTEYTTGDDSTLKWIIGFTDPNQALMQAGMVEQLAGSTEQAIADAKAARVQLETAQSQADDAKKDADKAAKDAAKQKKDIEKNLASQKKLLDTLKEQERKRLEEEKKAQDEANKAAAFAVMQRQYEAQQKARADGKNIPETVGQKALDWAMTQLGKPYVFGTAGPDTYDCSGLTMAAFSRVGITLDHSTYSQAKAGQQIPLGELQPGDLVVMNNTEHIGIYVGGGLIVHAPHTGDVVKVSAPWKPMFGVRLPEPASTEQAAAAASSSPASPSPSPSESNTQ